MTARELALAHLVYWTFAAEQLPAGASLLEPVDSSSRWWAIRNPHTGVVFGWHADARRLADLYWQALAEEGRCELVAEAVSKDRDAQHRIAWSAAWSHWTRDVGARDRAAERAVNAWLVRNRSALDAALLELSEDLYPNLDGPPPPPPPKDTDTALALRLATAALIEDEVDLARHIYAYVAVVDRDRRLLPALLSSADVVLDYVADQVGAEVPPVR